MKEFFQPAATFTLALAIASLGFTLPNAVAQYGNSVAVTTAPGDFLEVRGCD